MWLHQGCIDFLANYLLRPEVTCFLSAATLLVSELLLKKPVRNYRIMGYTTKGALQCFWPATTTSHSYFSPRYLKSYRCIIICATYAKGTHPYLSFLWCTWIIPMSFFNTFLPNPSVTAQPTPSWRVLQNDCEAVTWKVSLNGCEYINECQIPTVNCGNAKYK